MSATRQPRRKAVVKDVLLGGQKWTFWFGGGGVCVRRKHARATTTWLVPFSVVATGAGLEFEVAGRVFRAACRSEGVALCEVKAHARTRLLPWRKLVWEADLADDSAVQPALFREIE